MENYIQVGLFAWATVAVIGIVCAMLEGRRRAASSPNEGARAARREAEEQRKREAEERRIHKEQEEREAAVQADRIAARSHLEQFYRANQELIEDRYTPAFMDTFYRCDMPDALPPAALWAVAKKMIAEMQPLVAKGKKKRAAEEDCREAMERELASLRQYVDNLRKSPMGADVNETEILKSEARIGQIEAELRDRKLMGGDS